MLRLRKSFMGSYPGLHETCDGGCEDWLCTICTFRCLGCDSQTCERCTGSDLQSLPTASDHASSEHPFHRFIKLDRVSCKLGPCSTHQWYDELKCDLYRGIPPSCSRRCADKLANDLFDKGLDDDSFKDLIKTVCSIRAQDKWNHLVRLLKWRPALRNWRLRAAHNAHKPDSKGFKRSRDEFEKHASKEISQGPRKPGIVLGAGN